MSHTEAPLSPFIIEIAPTAWRQICLLSQETYASLMERLRVLADLATRGRHPIPIGMGGAEVETCLSFVVGELAALYEADFQARVIRLREVARSLPLEPLAVSGEAAERRASVR